MVTIIHSNGLKSPVPPDKNRWNFAPNGTNLLGKRFVDPANLACDRANLGRAESEESVWQKLATIYGIAGVPDAQYQDCIRGVIRLSEIDDPQKRQQALLYNAAWLFKRSNEALQIARQNVASGVEPWRGLEDSRIGIPASSELHFLSDSYKPWEKLSHNILANFVAHKVLNQILIESSIDVDGTLDHKTLLTVATRSLQALRQLHWVKRLMEVSSDYGIMETSINTARAEQKPYTGLEGPDQKITYVTHNSAIEEIAGYALADQLDMLGKINIAMGNAAINIKRNDYTYISGNFLLADRLVAYLGEDFLHDIFNQTQRDLELFTCEPKGLNHYMMDHEQITGKVVYQHFKRIVEFYEEEVVNRDKSKVSYTRGLANFKRRVLNDERCGALTGVEKWKEVYELEKNLAELESSNTETRGAIRDVREQLLAAKCRALPYIRLLGSPADPLGVQFKSEQNYYELLQTDPRAFFEKVTKGRPNGGCFHPYNSRNTPHETAKEYAFAKLRKYAYRDDVRAKIRQLKYEFYKSSKIRNNDVENYVDQGMRAYFDEYHSTQGDHAAKQSKALIAYLNWRFLEHLKHNYQKDELKDCSLISLESKTVAFKESLKAEWETYWETNRVHHKDEQEAYHYKEWLKGKLLKEGFKNLPRETACHLASYLDGIVPDEYLEGDPRYQIGVKRVIEIGDGRLIPANSGDITVVIETVKSQADSLVVDEEAKKLFFPDELFAWRGKRAYDEQTSLLAVWRFDEKSDDIRKYGQFYFELLANDSKGDVISSFKECYLNGDTVMHSEDSSSGLSAHAAALQREGLARVVYNLISVDDIYREIIQQRFKLVENIEHAEGHERRKAATEELYYAYQRYGVYGLKEIDEKIYKVVVQQLEDDTVKLVSCDPDKPNNVGIWQCGTTPASKEDCITLKDGDVLEWGIVSGVGPFTEKQILKEIHDRYRLNIDRNLSPPQKLRKLAEIIQFLTGESIEYREKELQVAQEVEREQASGKKPHQIDPLKWRLYEQYRWALTEKRAGTMYTLDHPSCRVIREYHDEETGKIYYRFRSDCKLYTRQKEEFEGDENNLKVKVIERDNHGIFVYRENGKPFNIGSPWFMNSLYIEEDTLLSPSPVGGFFTSKFLMNIIGGGNAKVGANRFEGFLRKLPQRFSTFLEWAGGLLMLGGVVRLIGHVVGGEFGKENGPVYRFGYWLSQFARTFACTGGALRGILNVNRNWDIAAGELINIGAALFAPNGLKHLLFGLGNVFLFTGRGIDVARRAQRVNAPTEEELKANKLLDHIVDPRDYVMGVVKFSQDGIVIPIKRAFEKHGLSTVFGELVGRLVSATVTPFRFIADVVKNPKLIFQWKKRRSEQSGVFTRLCPSTGHLMGIVGVLSGIGAILAGTVGRMQRFGEVAEHGFNRVGNWAISFATSIASVGIFANGLELAANPLGLPKLYRGLDGKDRTYSPKRAGLGQVASSFGYLVTPLFGLHKDWAAAIYDIINGLYFGLPKARMSVAQEEEINSFHLAKSMLVEGQKFFKDREEHNLNIDKAYIERMNNYIEGPNGKWVYKPDLAAAA